MAPHQMQHGTQRCCAPCGVYGCGGTRLLDYNLSAINDVDALESLGVGDAATVEVINALASELRLRVEGWVCDASFHADEPGELAPVLCRLVGCYSIIKHVDGDGLVHRVECRRSFNGRWCCRIAGDRGELLAREECILYCRKVWSSNKVGMKPISVQDKL